MCNLRRGLLLSHSYFMHVQELTVFQRLYASGIKYTRKYVKPGRAKRSVCTCIIVSIKAAIKNSLLLIKHQSVTLPHCFCKL